MKVRSLSIAEMMAGVAALAIGLTMILRVTPIPRVALLGLVPLFVVSLYGIYRACFGRPRRAFWVGFAAVGGPAVPLAAVFHDAIWRLFLVHVYPYLRPGVRADPESLLVDRSGLTIPYLWWRDPTPGATLQLVAWPELSGAFAVHSALLMLAGLALMAAGGLVGYLTWSTGDYLVRRAAGGSSTGAEVGTPARGGRVIDGEGTR